MPLDHIARSAAVAAGLIALGLGAARAQDAGWPTRAVTVLIPFSAGGRQRHRGRAPWAPRLRSGWASPSRR